MSHARVGCFVESGGERIHIQPVSLEANAVDEEGRRAVDAAAHAAHEVGAHAFLERLGVRRPVLIGWSQGVQDVAAYVERYGTKELAGIVLVDAAISDGADGMAARPQETAEQFKMFAFYQAHQPEYLGGMMKAIISKPQDDDAMNGLVSTGMKTPPDIGVGMLVADMFGVNRTSAVKKIDCPTLIIASAKSDELPRQQAAANQIPRAHFEKVDDCAHAVFLDQPDRFDELLKSFVTTLPQKPARN